MKHLLLILLLISTTGFARSISYHCDNDLTFNPRTFTIKVTQRLFFGSSFCLKDINARKCSFKKRLSHGESVSSPDKFLSSEHVLKFRNFKRGMVIDLTQILYLGDDFSIESEQFRALYHVITDTDIVGQIESYHRITCIRE